VLGRRLHEVLSATEPPALRALTAREREVLSLIAAGHANSAIAGRLGLSPKTVSNHISAVFAKLRLATRAELIVFARENGVLAD
jgi:DNA-binding NarL/FixJ family response regulator